MGSGYVEVLLASAFCYVIVNLKNFFVLYHEVFECIELRMVTPEFDPVGDPVLIVEYLTFWGPYRILTHKEYDPVIVNCHVSQ